MKEPKIQAGQISVEEGGVIDPDYTGNMGVILHNQSQKKFCRHPG